jgi:hypothetical protein
MTTARRIAAALVHHPVLDREARVVTTAITNLDLHDLARSAHCYGLTDLFVVHPVAAQRDLALRVREHWTTGSGARRIPDRKPALETLRVVASLEEAILAFGQGAAVEIWTTSARASAGCVSHPAARQRIAEPGSPVMVLFGTGWGLSPELIDGAHLRLPPIVSPRADGYNHLSVRAAAAITFDRLLGPGEAG